MDLTKKYLLSSNIPLKLKLQILRHPNYFQFDSFEEYIDSFEEIKVPFYKKFSAEYVVRESVLINIPKVKIFPKLDYEGNHFFEEAEGNHFYRFNLKDKNDFECDFAWKIGPNSKQIFKEKLINNTLVYGVENSSVTLIHYPVNHSQVIFDVTNNKRDQKSQDLETSLHNLIGNYA